MYPDILQSLSAAVAKESHSGTLDNICGAICKMIVTNSAGVPLDQVGISIFFSAVGTDLFVGVPGAFETPTIERRLSRK